jgi:hypothetical protein
MLSESVVEPEKGTTPLTKANVRAFAHACKRETAYRRGERTPSPELLHLGDSRDTERRLAEEPLLRAAKQRGPVEFD